MPTSKQAKKRMRSDAQKHARNRPILTNLKNVKKKHYAITDVAVAETHVKAISKTADKAASKGIIPKKRADRIKSRAAKKVNALKTASK